MRREIGGLFALKLFRQKLHFFNLHDTQKISTRHFKQPRNMFIVSE